MNYNVSFCVAMLLGHATQWARWPPLLPTQRGHHKEWHFGWWVVVASALLKMIKDLERMPTYYNRGRWHIMGMEWRRRHDRSRTLDSGVRLCNTDLARSNQRLSPRMRQPHTERYVLYTQMTVVS